MEQNCRRSNFDHGMTSGARQTSFSISGTACLLVFSCTTVSRVYKEWCERQKTLNEWQFYGQKYLVDNRGRLR